MQVVEVRPTSPEYEAVINLHRAHKDSLGPMPYAAFEERAEAGTLLGVVDGGGIVGYVLYDLVRDEVALRHLCVDVAARGRGAARLLVDSIADRHVQRRGIRLRCRRDWDAAKAWPALGFEPRSDTPGRSKEGHLLTLWWRDFGHPTLFDWVPDTEARAPVVIDTNVFIDLFEERDGSTESRELLADWAADHIEVLITGEVPDEINNHESAEVREQQWSRAAFIPRADKSAGNWRPSEERLLQELDGVALSAHDRCDVRHLSRTATAGVDIFVTRDLPAIRKLSDAAASALGVRMVEPHALIRELRLADLGDYAPVSIEDTKYELGVAQQEDEGGMLACVDHGAGERVSDLRLRLRPVLGDPGTWESAVVREEGGAVVAFFARSVVGQELQVDLLRVGGKQTRARAVLTRHLVHMQRGHAASRNLTTVRVRDQPLAPDLTSALASESFVRDGTDWIAAPVRFCGSAAELRRLLNTTQYPEALQMDEVGRVLAEDQPLSAALTSELEKRHHPLKISDGGLASFLIPIAPAFAADLFDTKLSEGSLFQRDSTLGLSREHVYYRAPLAAGGLTAPARVAWYVSAGSGSQSGTTKAVRAVSRLDEVVIGDPVVLHGRFARLGVYSRPQVEQAARDGVVMAIRISDTELLETPVSLDTLRDLAADEGHTPFLQSVWKMPTSLFEKIYRQGARNG